MAKYPTVPVKDSSAKNPAPIKLAKRKRDAKAFVDNLNRNVKAGVPTK
jgi:hypothetical protein